MLIWIQKKNLFNYIETLSQEKDQIKHEGDVICIIILYNYRYNNIYAGLP